MNWAEALVSCTALICGTAVVVLLVWLRRQQQREEDNRERLRLEQQRRHPLEPVPQPDEIVRIVADPPPPAPMDTTEAYHLPETDIDNLAERLERLERNLQERP